MRMCVYMYVYICECAIYIYICTYACCACGEIYKIIGYNRLFVCRTAVVYWRNERRSLASTAYIRMTWVERER